MERENILIVGGAKGGLKTALHYASKKPNSQIIIGDIIEPDFSNIKKPDNLEYLYVDVKNDDSMIEFGKNLSKFGSFLDHYVNFVGGANPNEIRKEIGEFDLKTIDDSISFNLTSQIKLLNILVNRIKNSPTKDKSITFISSINATVGRWGLPIYSVAKAGFPNLAITLAHEIGKYNIRVNCLAPGTIISERTIGQGKDFGLLRNTTTIGKLVTSEQVSMAVYGFTHGDMMGCSGTTLNLDNGQNAKGVDYFTSDKKSSGL